MTIGDTIRVRRRWPGQVFAACHTSGARGVMTLIHKSIPIQVEKVIKDTAGRYIILQGVMFSEKINLINVYGPNDDNPSFYKYLFLLVANLPGQYFIGGDMNCTLDSFKDRSTGIDNTHTKSRAVLHNFMKDLNLLDIWRHFNPGKVSYSCYSGAYQTYARIDYFLISAHILNRIDDVLYHSIVISDHAAVELKYHSTILRKDPPMWRFQIGWLRDPSFIEYLGKQIDDYFELNTSETSACVRWEAFKAYIRGQIIGLCSSKAKKSKEELKELENQIKKLESKIFN